MIPRPDNPVIVAIDVSDLEVADRLAASLAGTRDDRSKTLDLPDSKIGADLVARRKM